MSGHFTKKTIHTSSAVQSQPVEVVNDVGKKNNICIIVVINNNISIIFCCSDSAQHVLQNVSTLADVLNKQFAGSVLLETREPFKVLWSP